jgi:hypothetical protein
LSEQRQRLTRDLFPDERVGGYVVEEQIKVLEPTPATEGSEL